MSDPEPAPARRRDTAFGITVASGALGAMLVSGWFGERVGIAVGLLVASAGGAIAGAVSGSSRDERLHAGGCAITAAVGIVFAVGWYIRDRTSVFNLELLLPAAIGGLPGLLAYFALGRAASEPRARAGAAVLLAAGAVALAFVVASPRGHAVHDRSPTSAAESPGLEVTAGERSTLRRRFGPSADSFLLAIDKANTLLGVYGPSGIARAGAAGQKLLGEIDQGLAALRADADRRIAAGEPAGDFEVLDDVERRVRAFLTARPAARGGSDDGGSVIGAPSERVVP